MKRKCLGCAVLIASGSRCGPCQRTKDAPRVAYKHSRYDAQYRKERTHWAQIIDSGAQVPCGRNCGRMVVPGGWDLDHLPHGLAPSCSACNRGAGS